MAHCTALHDRFRNMAIDESNKDAFHASETRAREEARDVFILGAGFSKQISRQMPLLKELSGVIASRVSEPGRIIEIPFMRTDVEMAMTFLSQPQPWTTIHRSSKTS